MYRLLLLLICSPLFMSCSKNYKIVGTSSVSFLDGKMLFVKLMEGDRLVKIDSAEVVHGKFHMKGTLDTACMALLYMDDRVIMPFVMENGKINISIDHIGMKVKGTPLNDSFNDFVVEQNMLNDKAYEVERLESRMIMDGRDYDDVQTEIFQQRKELSDKMNMLVKTFIGDNYDNVLGAGVFMLLCGDMQTPAANPLMREILDEAPQSFLDIPCISRLAVTADIN